MKAFSRADRVGSLILKHLSMLLRKDIRDPRLDMTTITGVKMSPDLKLAKIYFCVTGGEKRVEESLEGFRSALKFIRRSLAPELGLRYMPELAFFYDESLDYGERIDQVLSSLNISHGEDSPSSETE